MSEIEKYITDEMRQKLALAKRQSLQDDLRVVASRIRDQAPEGSPDFAAGVDWAVLFIENTANALTQR